MRASLCRGERRFVCEIVFESVWDYQCEFILPTQLILTLANSMSVSNRSPIINTSPAFLICNFFITKSTCTTITIQESKYWKNMTVNQWYLYGVIHRTVEQNNYMREMRYINRWFRTMICEGLPQLTACFPHAASIATSNDPASGESMPRGDIVWWMCIGDGVYWRANEEVCYVSNTIDKMME